MNNTVNCMNCLYKSRCLKRNLALFMPYIIPGRSDELSDELRDHFDCSTNCRDWVSVQDNGEAVNDSTDKSGVPHPVGSIDFLGSDGSVRESCHYYTDEEFLKAVKKENHYGVPMVINVYRDKMGNTIPLGFTEELNPLPQGFRILDYGEIS